MNVVIAGAGIGGLTLAAALQREGVSVRLFERAPKLAPVGAGLVVQINAMRALAQYGLVDAVLSAGAALDESQVRDWRGRVLTRASMAEQAKRFGQPLVAAHRARLHDALLGLINRDTLTLGRAVTAYDEREDHVVVTLDDGQTLPADLLVGADGLHSRVRTQLLGDAPTRYSGYTSWRGICSTKGLALSGAMSESWGAGLRFGIVPIGFDELYWFATENAPPGGKDGDVVAELLARFGAWHAPIGDILRSTSPERIIRTDISDRVPVTRWTSARVALLGDAAHPMTPNLGQGACQAIEDAVVLSKLLAKGGVVKAALGEYEARRVARANGIVTQAHRIGAMGQLENPLARGLRDGVLRLFGSRLGNAGLDALYGFSV